MQLDAALTHYTGWGAPGRTSMGGQYPASWFCQEAKPWHVWAPKEKRPGVCGSSCISPHPALILLTNSTREPPPLAPEPGSLSCGAAWEWGLSWLTIAAWLENRGKNVQRKKTSNLVWHFLVNNRVWGVLDYQTLITSTLYPSTHITARFNPPLSPPVQHRNIKWRLNWKVKQR